MSKESFNLEISGSFKNNFLRVISKTYVLLSILAFTGIIIRLIYFPYDLPITHDGDNFFSYALDISILNNIPENYTLPNNGWPLVLSLFFEIFEFDSAIEYMNLQRVLSMGISVITIVPVYLLCKRFFSSSLSIIGSGIFTFIPQIIQNSFLGISEPLYIFLITISIFLFLSEKTKIVYYGFWILALASIVRYEGIVLLIPFSIMFFFKSQNKKRQIPKYIFVITIFVLILLPIAYIRTETTNNDGFTNVIKGPQYILKASSDTGESYHKSIFDFIRDGIIGIFKHMGWSLIPFFIILIPFGIIKLFKNSNHNKKVIILVSIFLLFPAFYAYSREFQETRYLFVMYPIFSLISLYLIEVLFRKIKKPKITSVLLLTIVLCSSILFISFQLPNYEYERESLEISHYIYYNTDGINWYYPETKYLVYLKYDDVDEFPVLSTERNPTNIMPIDNSKSIKSVLEYLEITKDMNLTHIITNGKNAGPQILNDVFFNEEKYPYLEKVFDSKEAGYQYDMKIFEIDFEMIREMNNLNTNSLNFFKII